MLAIFNFPIAAATFSASQSRNFRKPSKIFAKRLERVGKFDWRKAVSWSSRRRNLNIVMSFDGVRESTSNEGVQALEQEAFIEGSASLGAGGLEATLNSSSKWLVFATFGAIVLWRHDAEALWATMGAVLNVILSITLKKVLNQERPISTLRPDPGMPSSHAQSIFYATIFLNLSMIEWYKINGLTIVLSGLLFMLGSYFSWLRVSQRLHTVSQVVVGAIVGSVFSIIWFSLWKVVILDAFVSYLWVRVVVVLGAVGFCVGFLHHVYRSWIMDEE